MAHFAKIGLNGKVIEVQSVVNEVLHDANGVEQENIGIDFLTKLVNITLLLPRNDLFQLRLLKVLLILRNFPLYLLPI